MVVLIVTVKDTVEGFNSEMYVWFVIRYPQNYQIYSKHFLSLLTFSEG